ncbi:alpha-ketoglutarate-dependent dioxygenase alkB homolog 6-like isoform X2 [Xenia sp. Carnegie-2017]|uniref:alpha-ketoglutarate-dependent dioxygenase alkB homolog 6-like isoform X2 n=1 Tax=Xenia sp. Carnegie-2017 TaxID=2897299 RepID=UPI001F050031|nr:alpha-ketoglutarate-dependent dioxygenase alkB homolog 6-like isoform X2 [Xenia sp. Carnegie-2017]
MLLLYQNGPSFPKDDYKTGGMIPETLPKWLSTYTDKLGSLGIFGNHRPNHVLVNEYTPGQGIMPHVDGPLFYPVVATINLKSHCVLDFYHPVDTDAPVASSRESEQEYAKSSAKRHVMSLLVQRRSAYVFEQDMYTKYLHGISERKVDTLDNKVLNLDSCSNVSIDSALKRETRVSLTVRFVPKVLNVKLKFGRK